MEDLALILAELKVVNSVVQTIKKEDLPRLEGQVRRINGTLDRHADTLQGVTTRLAVREAFCEGQVVPALKQIVDNRINIAVTLAKIGAGGFGVGSGVGLVVYFIGRAAGWWA